LLAVAGRLEVHELDICDRRVKPQVRATFAHVLQKYNQGALYPF
jgi:hypothetical protein